ncbi:MAG: glycosyltransferase family 2 protein [Spartobacteria bacterium]|nr:glycosyltransferase family 2 protein [Spartobacteria bacterium]
MTASNPTVSIIMPVYNGQKYLSEAIESVLAQTFSSYELLIVDDGSQDDSYATATAFAKDHPEHIRLFTHPNHRNRGVATSRNLALKQARGAYVAFLDQDDYWHREKLQKHVAFMDAHPEVALSYTQAGIVRAGDGSIFTPGVETLGDEPPTEFLSAFFKIILIELNYIFSAVMMRTTVLRDLGGLPERLPFQSDDRIMVAQVSMDHAIARLPEVLCYFRAHDDHYTANVLRSGIGPMLVFDLQTRLVNWLLKNDHGDVAEYTTYYILPRTYADALVFLRSVGPGVLIKQVFGKKTPNHTRVTKWLLRCLAYRVGWKMNDPLSKLLHTVRRQSCWSGRHQVEDQINQRDYTVTGDGRRRAAFQPVVSVILVAHNDDVYLGETIESIRAQTVKDIEILVVNNHSTDASERIAETYAKDPAGHMASLTLPPGMSSPIQAANLALSIARSRYICFVRAGDRWPPDKLEKLVAHMEQHTDTALCLCGAYEVRFLQKQGQSHRDKPGIQVTPPNQQFVPAFQVVSSLHAFALNTSLFRASAFSALNAMPKNCPPAIAPAVFAAGVCASARADSLAFSEGEYRTDVDTIPAPVRLLSMQTHAMKFLLRQKRRAHAIDIAARLLPGAMLQCLRAQRWKGLGTVTRALGSVLVRFPHWPLIVLRFRAAQRRKPS